MEPCKQEEAIGALKQGMKNFERWNKAQNGAIKRIEAKVDRFNDKANQLLAGVAVACVLLVVDIALRFFD